MVENKLSEFPSVRPVWVLTGPDDFLIVQQAANSIAIPVIGGEFASIFPNFNAADASALFIQFDLLRANLSGIERSFRLQENKLSFPLVVLQRSDLVTTKDVRELTATFGNVSFLQPPLHEGLVTAALVGAMRADERRRNAQSADQQFREALARERARAAELDAIMEAVPVATFISRDPECRTVVGSRMTYDLFQRPFGSNLSRSALDGESPSNFRVMKNGREIPAHELPGQVAARSGRAVFDSEFDIAFDDGRCRTLFGNAVPLHNEDGTKRGAVAGFLDITERKHLEELLRQAHKVEGLGMLAGGIAHHLNNLLTAIMGNASLLLGTRDPFAAECIDNVLAASDKAAGLVNQLLAYSGNTRFNPRCLDVSRAVAELRDAGKLAVPAHVQLEFALGENLGAAQLDPELFSEILTNLILNACEAIEASAAGKVTVTTFARRAERAFTDNVGQKMGPGRYICLEVTDTGMGIDSSTLARIFDPFYSTKFLGRGLGLAAVAGALRVQDSAITVKTSAGAGSAFCVFFPAAPAADEWNESLMQTSGRLV